MREARLQLQKLINMPKFYYEIGLNVFSYNFLNVFTYFNFC